MRVGSQNQANSNFFKTASAAENSNCITEQRHRLWLYVLNTTSSPTENKETLVGYSPLATTMATLDRDYDATMFMLDPYNINLYSLSPANDKLTIQGRYLGATFNTNDVIPLGFTCKLTNNSTSATVRIGISELDGLFQNKEIYLRETIGTVVNYYNLNVAPYVFTINADVIDNTSRFAIVFTAPNTIQLSAASCGQSYNLDGTVYTSNVTNHKGMSGW